MIQKAPSYDGAFSLPVAAGADLFQIAINTKLVFSFMKFYRQW